MSDIIYIIMQYEGTRKDYKKAFVTKVYNTEEKAIAACERWNAYEDEYYYTYETWMVK